MSIDELIRRVRALLDALDTRDNVEHDYERRGGFALWTPDWIAANDAAIKARRELWDFILEAK
jgi:hypothetical protein